MNHSEKISSIDLVKSRASRKARGKLGSNFPVSIALTDWRDTPSFSARSAWLQFLWERRSRKQFFTDSLGGEDGTR
jgi:hypothetical protein